MSDRKRTREKEDRRDHKRHKSSKQDLEKLKSQTKKLNQEVQKIKHVETFYEKPPPGFIKVVTPAIKMIKLIVAGAEQARDFLAHAPTKGLWMPLGKEVKVMQCWRCKRYGHRTGDKECPFFIKGNQKLEQFRVTAPLPLPLPPTTTTARKGKRGRRKRRKKRRRERRSKSTSPPKPAAAQIQIEHVKTADICTCVLGARRHRGCDWSSRLRQNCTAWSFLSLCHFKTINPLHMISPSHYILCGVRTCVYILFVTSHSHMEKQLK
uniref:Uncharacterized protein n=1 Tax=Mola mola TaxID=94237 RepID=A0A3Q3X5C1_MOLML